MDYLDKVANRIAGIKIIDCGLYREGLICSGISRSMVGMDLPQSQSTAENLRKLADSIAAIQKSPVTQEAQGYLKELSKLTNRAVMVAEERIERQTPGTPKHRVLGDPKDEESSSPPLNKTPIPM